MRRLCTQRSIDEILNLRTPRSALRRLSLLIHLGEVRSHIELMAGIRHSCSKGFVQSLQPSQVVTRRLPFDGLRLCRPHELDLVFPERLSSREKYEQGEIVGGSQRLVICLSQAEDDTGVRIEERLLIQCGGEEEKS